MRLTEELGDSAYGRVLYGDGHWVRSLAFWSLNNETPTAEIPFFLQLRPPLNASMNPPPTSHISLMYAGQIQRRTMKAIVHILQGCVLYFRSYMATGTTIIICYNNIII